MGCIIKIGNQSVSKTDFLNHLNKIISVNKLFEENSDFSSQIYEALGFKTKENVSKDSTKTYEQAIKKIRSLINTKIGKYIPTDLPRSSYDENKRNVILNYDENIFNNLLDISSDILQLYSDFKYSVNNAVRLSQIKKLEYGELYNEFRQIDAFVDKLRDFGIEISQNIFDEIYSKIDNINNISQSIDRDSLLPRIDKIKQIGELRVELNDFLETYFEEVINLNKVFTNYLIKPKNNQITPQQKQQAQQRYAQYLDSLNKPNTNPILQGNQKPDVILLIGTSGSGKSTFIKSLPQENLVVIEPDAMRVEFTGDMNDKSKDKEIYEEAAKRAVAAIKQGKQVVFDTTNLTKDKRLPFIEAIKKEIPNANIQYKLMELNPELANDVYVALGTNQNIVEIFEGFWNRQQVALQTDKVFLFGDNTNDRTITKYVPSATQAVIRGLSNAIGIDTKKDRGTLSSSYLTDNDFEWFKNHVDEQIQKAKDSGKTIVIPADGIGTGKAMLKEKAPKLFEYLQQKLNELKNRANVPDATIDRHAESYKQMLEDIKDEPISNFDVQQEQVKKFVELQERLNNKEFLEGAKNAYESTPELQQFGTQEEYNDYIARVSLGIIKNPSSGEYNYESKVKDIVYHNTDEQFDVFKVPFYAEDMYGQDAPIGVFFSTDKQYTSNFGKRKITAILNLKNPKFEKEIEYEKVAGYRLGKKTTEFDGFYGNDKMDLRDAQPSQGTEYVVFEPEQIHILSSKADIQGFKDYMAFQNSEFSKYGTYEQFRQFITSKSPMEIENKLIETGKIDRKC